MSNKTFSAAEIDKLIKENEQLKRENKHLKRLTSSKRYHFAVKVGDSYNQLFPLNSRRRNFTSAVGNLIKKQHSRHAARTIRRQALGLSRLAASYDKVIVLNSILYDVQLKQRPHHLAKEFAALGFFVIYLEPDNPINAVRTIDKNLITINNFQLLSRIDTPQRFFLTPNNMPTPLSTLQQVQSWGFRIIYDYLDEFHEDISGDLAIQMEVWQHLSDLSPILCVATANRLKKHLTSHIHDTCPVIMASNAVDVDQFDFRKQTKSVPEDLKNILKTKHPIIGFYGALAPWIDFKLIHRIAKNHPEWEIVLIGIDYNNAMEELQFTNNIHYLGPKTYDQLVQYSKFFNCAIIPFKTGEIAKATSPVKLFEYMATGLPTVCTRDLEECKGYDYVYIAKNEPDFEAKVAQAIIDHKSSKIRMQLLSQAADNTWAKRVEAIAKNLTGGNK